MVRVQQIRCGTIENTYSVTSTKFCVKFDEDPQETDVLVIYIL